MKVYKKLYFYCILYNVIQYIFFKWFLTFLNVHF